LLDGSLHLRLTGECSFSGLVVLGLLTSAAEAQSPTSFGPDTYWNTRNSGVGYNGLGEWFADLNADSIADHIYNPDGTHDVVAMISTTGAPGPEQYWGTRAYGVGYSGHSQWFGDLNGDGRADLVYNKIDTRELHVLVNNSHGYFNPDTPWGERLYGVGYNGNAEWLIDVNGDGFADYVYNKDGTKEMHVLLSTGTSFGMDQNWGSRFYSVGYSGNSEWLVDVNGDGLVDYVYNKDGSKEMHVLLNTGAGFGTDSSWGSRSFGVGYSGQAEWFADIDGDGKADYIYNKDASKELRVMLGSISGFGQDRLWGTRTYGVGYNGKSEWFSDVNGDGRADYVYNHDGTRDIQAMVSTGVSLGTDTTWGGRAFSVGYDGTSEWIVDVNGDHAADHVYNPDGSKQLWLMTSGM
jgi:hypothetical protein